MYLSELPDGLYLQHGSNQWLISFGLSHRPMLALPTSQVSSLPSPGGGAANALPVSAAEILEDLTKERRARMQKHEKKLEKSLQDLVAAQEASRKELLARLEAEKQGIEGDFESARLRLEGELSALSLG